MNCRLASHAVCKEVVRHYAPCGDMPFMKAVGHSSSRRLQPSEWGALGRERKPSEMANALAVLATIPTILIGIGSFIVRCGASHLTHQQGHAL